MTEKTTITIVGLMADKNKVTFFLKDGETHIVQQSDPRLPVLLEQVNRVLAREPEVTISLTDYSIYAEFEKQTGGLVRFFRATKKAVQSIVEAFIPPIKPEPEEKPAVTPATVTTGEIPERVPEAEVVLVDPEPKPEPVVPPKPRYEDIKEELKPVKNDQPIPEDETLVAVINGVAIPGMEALKPYIQNSLRHNSPKAVVAFLERIAQVIDQRGHSIPDLMKFLERGDLPLAEDGSIIGYKILRKSNAHPGFTYVDCHTGKVHQRVGTKVNVAEDMVDKNRHNECSNGLHVARRGYIGSFSGDLCTMIKMNPEDVIAVPHRDGNKVRVSAYHIIFELSNSSYNLLRSNKPMTSDPESAAMLAKAISGDHVGVLEEVWIGGQQGSNLSVKNKLSGKEAVVEKAKTKITGEDLAAKALAMDDAQQGIEPKELNQKIKAEKEKVAAERPTKGNLKDDYLDIIRNNDVIGAEGLLAQKKKAKKSWVSFGLPEDAGTVLAGVISGFNKDIVQATKEAVKAEPKKEPKPATSKKKGIPTPAKTVVASVSMDAPPKEWAAYYFQKKDWIKLYELKKSKKVGWSRLGFTEDQESIIRKNEPK